MSKIQTISVICFLSYSVIIGALVFCRGFLLNRQVIADKAGPCLDTKYKHHYHYHNDNLKEEGDEGQELLSNLSDAASWCNQSPVFKKAILVLVDALRYDFVGRMEFLSKITEERNVSDDEIVQKKKKMQNKNGGGGGNSACLFRFVADPPTTTMQRLKALMTGTMPTFIDASANFNSYEIEEDSLIHQLYSSGKKIAFLGDDTWLSLFPSTYFTSPVVEAYPSFNAWDLDTVDRAINVTFRTKIFPPRTSHNVDDRDKWDVLVAHILGVDHCGHRYGPSHPEMKRKLREADEIIKFVYERMNEDTLLVVFGDHGMTHTGDHGGDSKDETDAAVIFISKKTSRTSGVSMTIKSASAPFQCPSFTSGISQIDLVPTLATLLGVPIPFSSLGQLIPNFLPNKNELYTDALSSNVAQVHRYMSKLGLAASSSLSTQYQRLQDAFEQFQWSRTNITAKAKVNSLSHRYLNEVKQYAVSQWTQFNVPMIYTGVTISSLALLSLAIYLQNLPYLLRAPCSSYTVLSWLWPSLPLWSVLLSSLRSFFKLWTPSTPSSTLASVIVSTLGGLSMFILCLLWSVLQNAGNSPSTGKLWNFSLENVGSLLLYTLTCLAMFSNSFVINEGYMLGSSLMLIVVFHIIFAKETDSTSKTPHLDSDARINNFHTIKRVKCCLVCFLILGLLVRVCSIFFRCREELQECTEEYLLHKQLSSLPDSWLVHKYVRYSIALVSLAVFVVAFRLWMLYQKCLFTKRPAAYVAKFIPSLLVVLLGVFWALQGLPFISSSASKLRPILNNFPWVFQASTFISLVLVWLKPLFSPSIHSSASSLLFQLASKSNRPCSMCVLPSKNLRIQPSPSDWTKAPPQIQKNGLQKSPNGLMNSQSSALQSIYADLEKQQFLFDDPSSLTFLAASDNISSALLLFTTLCIILLCQVTSVGIAPAVSIICPYVIVCLVGVFRTGSSSWSAAICWTLASQYLVYGTGHQPIFSAIPWDSAFLSTADGQNFADSSDSLLTWVRPCLAILGNLHVSQIIFSLSLPLLSYWTSSPTPPLCRDHSKRFQNCKVQRKRAHLLCGKFIFLHGLKLLCTMMCAGYHRRHLMVWKIFAPKFIFEAVSFIVTTFAVIFSLVFITRIDYLYHRNRHKMNTCPSSN